MSKLRSIALGVLAISMAFTGIAYAQEEIPENRIRKIGEVIRVDYENESFVLHARAGEDFEFEVTNETIFKSRDGSIDSLDGMAAGMHAVVVGHESSGGILTALWVGVGVLGDEHDRIRIAGEITGVDVAASSFSLETKQGDVFRIQTGERTQFRSRDGSIASLDDLKPGMVALVIAVKQDDGGMFALVVAAGSKQDIPDDAFRAAGEITAVNPDAASFSLKTQEATFRIETSERTRYKGDAISELEDLQVGMHALVIGVEQEDGTLLALVVAAGRREDRPDIDVRAAGKIVALGGSTLTIQTQSGDRLTFMVDGSTIFKSRKGEIDGLEDLEIGLLAAVGAIETDGGELLAKWVGVGKDPESRPDQPDQDRPNRAPDRRPEPDPTQQA